MPPKSKTNKWVDLQLAIAAISLTSVLMLWNMFAGPDRNKAEEKAAADEQAAKIIPTETLAPEPVVVATMPPEGYTILFGGEAPKPQVIVVQNKNGGGGSGGGGGGGGGGASAVTSTKSS
jgi:hypothetical protein